MLESKNETNVSYFKEHDQIMGEVDSLQRQIIQYKEELYAYIEKLM